LSSDDAEDDNIKAGEKKSPPSQAPQTSLVNASSNFIVQSNEQPEKIQNKQIIFPHSYEGINTSRYMTNAHAAPGVWRNSNHGINHSQNCTDSAVWPMTTCQPSAFNMDEAIAFHRTLVEATAQGIDVRETVEKMEEADLDRYIPVDDQGQQMSLGSIAHLLSPHGTHCKPCSCYPRGKCYRGKACLHCHYYHSTKARNRPDALKKRRAAQHIKKERMNKKLADQH
jgi:hypothetical protein